MKVFFCCICASFLLFFLFIVKVHQLSELNLFSVFNMWYFPHLFVFFPSLFWMHICPQTTICCPYHECVSYYSFGFSSLLEQLCIIFVFFSVFSQPSQRFSPAMFWVFCFFFSCLGLCCCMFCFSRCCEQGLSSCSAQTSHCGGSSSCRVWALGRRHQ